MSRRCFLEGPWSSGDVCLESPWAGSATGDDVSAGADDRVMSVGPDNGVIGVSFIVGAGADIEAISAAMRGAAIKASSVVMKGATNRATSSTVQEGLVKIAVNRATSSLLKGGEVNIDVSRAMSVSSSKGGEAGESLSGAGAGSSRMGTLTIELVL